MILHSWMTMTAIERAELAALADANREVFVLGDEVPGSDRYELEELLHDVDFILDRPKITEREIQELFVPDRAPPLRTCHLMASPWARGFFETVRLISASAFSVANVGRVVRTTPYFVPATEALEQLRRTFEPTSRDPDVRAIRAWLDAYAWPALLRAARLQDLALLAVLTGHAEVGQSEVPEFFIRLHPPVAA